MLLSNIARDRSAQSYPSKQEALTAGREIDFLLARRKSTIAHGQTGAGTVRIAARSICTRMDNGKRIFDVLSSPCSFFHAFDTLSILALSLDHRASRARDVLRCLIHARSHRSSRIKRSDAAIFISEHETTSMNFEPGVNSRIGLN